LVLGKLKREESLWGLLSWRCPNLRKVKEVRMTIASISGILFVLGLLTMGIWWRARPKGKRIEGETERRKIKFSEMLTIRRRGIFWPMVALFGAAVLVLGISIGYSEYVGRPAVADIWVGEYPIEGYVVKDGYVYIPVIMSEPGEDYRSEYRKFDKRAFAKIEKNANYLVVKYIEEWEVTKPRLIKKLYLECVPMKK
jgi:hypothetical protein